MPCIRLAVFATLLVLAGARPVAGAPQTSGLPLPRFVSLRATEVNMRAGPGFQYPVEWVYRRQNMPVEVIAEYRNWRKVRDPENTEGWIHKSMLSGRRTVVVTGGVRTLRSTIDPDSPPAARVEAGVVGRLLACPEAGTACRIRLDGHEGWLERGAFWGADKDEVVN